MLVIVSVMSIAFGDIFSSIKVNLIVFWLPKEYAAPKKPNQIKRKRDNSSLQKIGEFNRYLVIMFIVIIISIIASIIIPEHNSTFIRKSLILSRVDISKSPSWICFSLLTYITLQTWCIFIQSIICPGMPGNCSHPHPYICGVPSILNH